MFEVSRWGFRVFAIGGLLAALAGCVGSDLPDDASDSPDPEPTPVTLRSIALTPADASLPVGGDQPYTATGTYSDGSRSVITSGLSWSVADTTVASIGSDGESAGLLRALAVGGTTVSALDSASGVSGSTGVTVTAAQLGEIRFTVATGTGNVPAGFQAQIVATGYYTDGREADISAQANWSVDDDEVATVGNAETDKGLLSALATGTVVVDVELDGFVASTVVTVTDAAISAIALTPPDLEFGPGERQQFRATGTFADGNELIVTERVDWASSSSFVVTVSNEAGSKGLATAGSLPGRADVTATSGSVTATAQVTRTLF